MLGKRFLSQSMAHLEVCNDAPPCIKIVSLVTSCESSGKITWSISTYRSFVTVTVLLESGSSKKWGPNIFVEDMPNQTVAFGECRGTWERTTGFPMRQSRWFCLFGDDFRYMCDSSVKMISPMFNSSLYYFGLYFQSNALYW